MRRAISLKWDLLLSLSILILLTPAITLDPQGITPRGEDPPERTTRSDLEAEVFVHLVIEGNSGMEAMADRMDLEGSGTREDPFVFRDLNFRYRNRTFNPILKNITNHVTFERCGFRRPEGSPGGSHSGGIFLMGCSNIAVKECSFERTEMMVRMENCSDIEVSFNTAKISAGGISCSGCDDIWVVRNTILGRGILLYGTENSTISGNTLVEHNIPVYFEYCKYCLFEKNEDLFSQPSITILKSHWITLRNNTWSNNPVSIRGGLKTFETFSLEGSNRMDGYEIELIRNRAMNGTEINSFGSQMILANVSGLRLKEDNGNMSRMYRLTMGFCENVTVDMSGSSNQNTTVEITRSSNCRILNGSVRSSYVFLNANNSRDIVIEDIRFLDWSTYSIILEDSTGCTIRDCVFNRTYGGLILAGSRGNLIQNNSFTESPASIIFYMGFISYDNRLENNEFMNSSMAFWDYWDKIYLLDLENNTINGKRVTIIKEKDMGGKRLEGEHGFLILSRVRDMAIEDQNMSEGGSIFVIDCSQISIEKLSMEGAGIFVSGSSDIDLRDLIFSSGNNQALYIRDSADVEMERCIFGNKGMLVQRTVGFTMSDNVFMGENGGEKVEFQEVENLTATGNTIRGVNSGLRLEGVKRGVVEDSTIVNAEPAVSVEGSESTVLINVSMHESNRGVEIVDSSGTRIERCLFEKLYTSIYIRNSTGDRISENRVISSGISTISIYRWRDSELFDNHLELQRGSAIINVCSNIEIRKNRFVWTRSGRGSTAFSINDGDSILLSDNILDNSSHIALSIADVSDSRIEGCRFNTADIGIEMQGCSYNRVVNNLYRNCSLCLRISDMNYYPFTSSGNNVIYGNEFLFGSNLSRVPERFTPAVDNSSMINHWYSRTRGGNMWQGYNGPDEDRDGIVDVPYFIQGTAKAVDEYPVAHGEYVENDSGSEDDVDLGRIAFLAIFALITILLVVYLVTLRFRSAV